MAGIKRGKPTLLQRLAQWASRPQQKDKLKAEYRRKVNAMSSVHSTTTKCLITGEPCPPGIDDENYLQNCCWYNYDCRLCMYDMVRCRRYPEKAKEIEEAAASQRA